VKFLSIGQEPDVLRQTAVALIDRERPALTVRQLGVFLTCYLMDDVQTVRDLCWKLNTSKPAVARALDHLAELGLDAPDRSGPLCPSRRTRCRSGPVRGLEQSGAQVRRASALRR
jgi:hypothetical protein